MSWSVSKRFVNQIERILSAPETKLIEFNGLRAGSLSRIIAIGAPLEHSSSVVIQPQLRERRAAPNRPLQSIEIALLEGIHPRNGWSGNQAS
jgi:hypothetical protein